MWKECKMEGFLTSVGYITMWFYRSLAGSETLSHMFKEQRQIEVEKGCLDCHVTPYKARNRHANTIKP